MEEWACQWQLNFLSELRNWALKPVSLESKILIQGKSNIEWREKNQSMLVERKGVKCVNMAECGHTRSWEEIEANKNSKGRRVERFAFF